MQNDAQLEDACKSVDTSLRDIKLMQAQGWRGPFPRRDPAVACWPRADDVSEPPAIEVSREPNQPVPFGPVQRQVVLHGRTGAA